MMRKSLLIFCVLSVFMAVNAYAILIEVSDFSAGPTATVSTDGSILVNLNDFFADLVVTVAVDGTSATIAEDASLGMVLLSNDPGLGDPNVIIPGNGISLRFSYDFTEGAASDDEFGVFILDGATGLSLGPAFEFFTQDTNSGSVSFDLSYLVGDILGVQFQLASDVNFDSVDGLDSVLTISNVKLVKESVDDSYSTDEDTPLIVGPSGVLNNDTDVDNEPLTAILVSYVSNGTLSLNADGSFVYTPAPEYNGGDSFTYKANDGAADGNTATVTITVNAVNDAPVANDDSATTNEDVSVIITVLGNDTDVDIDNLTLASVTQGANGSVNIDGTYVTYIPNANYNGTDSFAYTVDDGNGGTDTAIVSITVNAVNDAPVAEANGPYTGEEGSTILFNANSSSDVDGDSLQYRWDFNNDGTWDTSLSNDATVLNTWNDNYTGTVALEVTDGELKDIDTTVVTVSNVPPTVGEISVSVNEATPVAPVVAIGDVITASASFSDPGTLDIHTAAWDWGDSYDPPVAGTVTETNGSGSVSDTHTYEAAGVYTIKLTVSDDDITSNESIFQFVVVYDATGGFVTGGGWIDSPPGAYTPADLSDPDLTGKANFGFVSKYKKGTDIPTGNTEFNFKIADLNFHSTEYEWLVVAGSQAKFKGTGTVNDVGNYGFMLSAVDADLKNQDESVEENSEDKFRIKIWDIDDGDKVLYDNQPGEADDADPTTTLGGGSIVIHGEKQGKPSAAPAMLPNGTRLLAAYPNPFNPDVWIPYQLGADSQITVRIYSLAGHLVRTLDLGTKSVGFYVDRAKAAHWDGRNEAGEYAASGIYFYSFQAGKYTATKKMIVAK